MSDNIIKYGVETFGEIREDFNFNDKTIIF